MMSAGIDYGMGKANVDPATGIRYGVISQHSVSDAWNDCAEPEYGDPSCPDCGGEVTDQFPDDSTGDYYCAQCDSGYWSDVAFPEDPIGWRYEGDDYFLVDCLGTDVMVLKSPFYTRARFCSPCVPGAGNLDSPDVLGVRTYCLGHDWFESGEAPYPVWSVATDERVWPSKED